ARDHPRHAHADHQWVAVSATGSLEAASGRGSGRHRHGRLLSRRVGAARTQIARRLHPVQAALARRSDRAGQDPHLGVNDRFLKACRREPVDVTPVWFMRQAGRYMADYRALRQRYSLLEICRTPELAVAVTLQPVNVIEVDAAILFSDLLIPFTR